MEPSSCKKNSSRLNLLWTNLVQSSWLNIGIVLFLQVYCLISNQKGLGTVRMRLKIMELAAIDPHSHKVQTKFYKNLTFGIHAPNTKQDRAI